MKLTIKNFLICLLFASLNLVSCSDWLEVSPSHEIKEEKLFENEAGFRNALWGVYASMSRSSCYGGSLNLGLVDALAQNYTNTSPNDRLFLASQYNYENPTVKIMLTSIWSAQYNVIANCNNMLDNLAEKDPSLFQGDNYNIFLAEGKALRAFLHFDMLRLFAPSIASGGADALAIPYVDKVQNVPFPQLTVLETLERIIEELREARELLRDIDPMGPVVEQGEYIEPPTLFRDFRTDEGFLLHRKSRVNYYAATAMLARVYLWKGDKELALEMAYEVLDSERIAWIEEEDLLKTKDPDYLFYRECIFSLFNQNVLSISDSYFHADKSLEINPERRIFYFDPTEGGGNDFRYLYHFGSKPGTGGVETIAKYNYLGNRTNYIPLIRLSEMLYIAAECEPDPTKSLELLNTIRKHRGYDEIVSLTGTIQEELYKEYRREFLAEGQMFFYLKRLNSEIIEYSTEVGSEEVYVLPIPDLEEEYGRID